MPAFSDAPPLPGDCIDIGAGETIALRLRLTAGAPTASTNPFGALFDATFEARQREADEFYQSITPPTVDAARADVMRQALAAAGLKPGDPLEIVADRTASMNSCRPRAMRRA